MSDPWETDVNVHLTPDAYSLIEKKNTALQTSKGVKAIKTSSTPRGWFILNHVEMLGNNVTSNAVNRRRHSVHFYGRKVLSRDLWHFRDT